MPAVQSAPLRGLESGMPQYRPTQRADENPAGQQDRPYLMSVRAAARYLGRTEKAVRHLYDRRILTPLRIDGRVFLDRREIDALYDKARVEAY